MCQSRCGLSCEDCAYKEPVACPGCIAMEKPFWGEKCPVKSCCEEKGALHCGQCVQFPCALLEAFAYDAEQGDDGARIETCRRWAGEKEATCGKV